MYRVHDQIVGAIWIAGTSSGTQMKIENGWARGPLGTGDGGSTGSEPIGCAATRLTLLP